jgi:ABC-type branched-subunit amino acid transport system substrate-binding protein
VLALPDPLPVTSVLPVPPERGALSRRRVLALGSAAGVVTAGGALAAWAAGRPPDAPGSLTAGGPRPRHVVGLHADLSGAGKSLGRAQERGARLALADFNSGADRAFDLELRVLDDGGVVARATAVARRFVADRDVSAVIGPTGNAAAEAVTGVYERALLPVVTVSADTDRFSSVRDRALFQLRPDQSSMSTAFVHYLTHTAKSRRTALVDDRESGRSSWEIVKDLTEHRPSQGTVTTHVVAAGTEDFGPVTAAVLAAGAQAVVYGGASPRRAALFARALERAGFRGARAAPEPVLGEEFLAAAGTAAEGWVFSTAYVDPAALPAAAGFVAAYRKAYGGRTVEPFAVEGYDALLFVAQGLRELPQSRPERGSLVRRLRSVKHRGLAKTIEFRSTTDDFIWTEGLFLHRVEDGAPRFLGHYEQVRPN